MRVLILFYLFYPNSFSSPIVNLILGRMELINKFLLECLVLEKSGMKEVLSQEMLINLHNDMIEDVFGKNFYALVPVL